MKTRFWLGTVAVAAAVALTGCSSGGSSDGGSRTATSGGSSAAAPAFPVTVTNCGKSVTIPSQPSRIVATDGAAETAFALGLGNEVVGYFGDPASKLPTDYRDQATHAKYLGTTYPSPSLEKITELNPDLVLLYGYFDDTGVTDAKLTQLGIPHLVLSESCPGSKASTLDGYFGDVATIAQATGTAPKAVSLVAGWKRELASALPAQAPAKKPSVFVQGNTDESSVFASGGLSLANDQIARAGGVNAFADTAKSFLTPSWEQVAERNPDVVVDGSGGGPKSLAALESYLSTNGALSGINAVKHHAFLSLEYAENVPGPRAVEGTVKLAKFLATHASTG